MPTDAQKQDKSIMQKFKIFLFFFLFTKKFDKKLVVDKSTYRHEWVKTWTWPRACQLMCLMSSVITSLRCHRR